MQSVMRSTTATALAQIFQSQCLSVLFVSLGGAVGFCSSAWKLVVTVCGNPDPVSCCEASSCKPVGCCGMSVFFIADTMSVIHLYCESLDFLFLTSEFTWWHLWSLRNGGALPDGTSVLGEKLIFGRPLRLNDSGLYECVVNNNLGVGKTEYTMTILGRCMTF